MSQYSNFERMSLLEKEGFLALKLWQKVMAAYLGSHCLYTELVQNNFTRKK